MPKKVSFATTNWKDKSNKPSNMTQAEWDAWNSSKFSGFPFPVNEKDEEGNSFSQWDKITLFQNQPSKYNNKKVSVLTVNYSYKFTLDELFQLFWNMKKMAPTKGAIRGTETDKRYSGYEYNGPIHGGSESFVLKNDLSNTPKSEEDELITKLDENYWNVTFTGGGSAGIDFRLPVFKTGEDEYRPYVWCDSCNCGGIFSPCKNIHDATGATQITLSIQSAGGAWSSSFTGSLISETNIIEQVDTGQPWYGNGNPPCRSFNSNHCGASISHSEACTDGYWVSVSRGMQNGVCGYTISTQYTNNGMCSANFSSGWGGSIFIPGDSPAGSHVITETGYADYAGYPGWDEETQTTIPDPNAYHNPINTSSTVSISLS